MDDTSKKTSIFGEILKTNLAADFIKVDIQKIISGFKKIKEAVISYVNTGIELSNAETENRQKLLQVMQNTMDARLEDAESIETLISSQEKLGVVSKTVQLGGQIISAIGEGLWAAIEPFSGQIVGWGLLIVGAIISLGPPIAAAISAVMAVVSSAIAAWPVALGIALNCRLLAANFEIF